jgi:L-ascorbate metabolism protein UlaG (beta-lactamase superfamily)
VSVLTVTYIGGPTALLEVGGLRLLTDPTFDPAGSAYPTPAYTLRKTQTPALGPEMLQRIDAVLLSHDHHADNLDDLGRASLPHSRVVYTTMAGAARLGGNAIGLEVWQRVELADGVQLTATPARHGPAQGDRGPVIGFVLTAAPPVPVVYVSGDTVWYDEVADVGRRFRPTIALLNLGAARVAAAGPSALTFTAAEAVELARAWPEATIVPLHFEGWEHFTEGRHEVDEAFQQAGLQHRLQWLRSGVRTPLSAAPRNG